MLDLEMIFKVLAAEDVEIKINGVLCDKFMERDDTIVLKNKEKNIELYIDTPELELIKQKDYETLILSDLSELTASVVQKITF